VNMKLGRKATLIAAGIGVAVLLGWLVTSQGPLAPAKVTLAKVEHGPLIASTFGIGTVEARRSYALGPTVASRVARVLVDQGDVVKNGQLLAELDPVDLGDRVASGIRSGTRRSTSAPPGATVEALSRAQLIWPPPVGGCAYGALSARKPPTPKDTKRMPQRRPSMRRPPNWRRRDATVSGRCPMSRGWASYGHRRGS
jgi:hypothetical protein